MKIHNSLRLNTLAVFGVALCSVGIEAKDETTIEMPPASTNVPVQIDSQGFLWRIHLEPGDKYQLRFFSRTLTTEKTPATAHSPAEEVEYKGMQRMAFNYDVLSVDRFGVSTVQVTYRDIAMEISTKVDGHAIASPVQSRMSSKLNQYLAAVYKNQSLKIKLTPGGQIWGIVGLKPLNNRLLKSLKGLSPQEYAQFKAFMANLLDEKYLKNIFGQVKDSIPNHKVNVGDTWNFNSPNVKYGPISFGINSKRTLNKLENNLAFMQEDSLLELASETTVFGGRNVRIKDFQGGSTGISKIDVRTGLPFETNVTQHLGMKIEVDFDGQTINIPNEKESQIRMILKPR